MNEKCLICDHVPLAGPAREEAISLESGRRTLHGNLIRCAEGASLGVLFIHGHGGVRSGPHNILTHMARALGEAGIPSIRFDLTGRGESDGNPPDTLLGHMAEDALSAATYLKKTAGVSRIVIVGICSGGNVGIGILDRLPECGDLYLMSVYPFGDADSFRRDAQRSVAVAKGYWKKLWLASTWKKLIRGEVQFKIIAGILFKPMKRVLKSRRTEAEPEASSEHPLENLKRRSIRLKMVYGSADPEFAPSLDYYRRFSEENAIPVQFETVDGANHNFYSAEWKERLSNELITFAKEA